MTQYLSPVVKGRLQIAHAKQVTWYTLWCARKTMSKAEMCLPQAAHALERPYILQKNRPNPHVNIFAVHIHWFASVQY